MLPVVPELGPEGYTHTADALPDAPRDALAILPDGDSWCRVNCPPGVAGRIHVHPTYADLYLGLNPSSGTLEYTDLTFGYDFLADGVLVESYSWPPPNIRKISSDQLWSLVRRVKYAVQSVLTLNLWAQDGQRFEATWEMQGPRPVQPFASWAWDGALWQSPVPYPTDRQDYVWDEPTQGWVLP